METEGQIVHSCKIWVLRFFAYAFGVIAKTNVTKIPSTFFF